MGTGLTRTTQLAATLVRTLNQHRDEEAPVFMRYKNPLDCPVCVRLIDDLDEAVTEVLNP